MASWLCLVALLIPTSCQDVFLAAPPRQLAKPVATRSYWPTYQKQSNFIGLVNHGNNQKFEVEEDNRGSWSSKQYHAALVCNSDVCNKGHMDPMTGETITKNMDARVLTVTNHYFTMSGAKSAQVFASSDGTKVGDFTIYNPSFIGSAWTWKVSKDDDVSKILYTIELQIDYTHCDFMALFGCKPVLKINVGDTNDWDNDDTLIYYGLGEANLGEPDFKFYHSKNQYDSNKVWIADKAVYEEDKAWVAKVEHAVHGAAGQNSDMYKVNIHPGEDAGLLLLATTCLDKVAGDNKKPEDAAPTVAPIPI